MKTYVVVLLAAILAVALVMLVAVPAFASDPVRQSTGYPTSWSSAGILFTKPANGWYEVWVRYAGVDTLVATNAANAVWSPDGNLCAFWRKEGSRYRLVIHGIETDPNRYTKTAAVSMDYKSIPCWVDSGFIYYTVSVFNHNCLAVLNVLRGRITQLTNWEGQDSYLDPYLLKWDQALLWSSNGYGIVLESLRSGYRKRSTLIEQTSPLLRFPQPTRAYGLVYCDDLVVYRYNPFSGEIDQLWAGTHPVVSPNERQCAYDASDGFWYTAEIPPLQPLP